MRHREKGPTFGQWRLEVTGKVSWPPGDDLGAKHDALFTQQADCAEGTVKVMMVDVRWYAVFCVIDIDDSCVWLLVFGQDAPPVVACKELELRI